jgi:hypothetical protein
MGVEATHLNGRVIAIEQGDPMQRYLDLVEATHSRTRVEPIRRLRAVARLLAATTKPDGVGFILWLGHHHRGALVRAAAGLADLGFTEPAEHIRAVLSPPSEIHGAPLLLRMDNAALSLRKRVGQHVHSLHDQIHAAMLAHVQAHPALRPDAAAAEIPGLPPGRLRWRVPAVTLGGQAGAAEVVTCVAQLLGHTVSRTRQRVEDQVRSEHGELLFHWGEPLQCARSLAAEYDSDPPVGTVAGDAVIRPVAVPTLSLVSAISSLLPEDTEQRVVRKDGRLQLIDNRAEAFRHRLAELRRQRRPLTRHARVAQRANDLITAFEAGGLTAWLTTQTPVLRQSLQALELIEAQPRRAGPAPAAPPHRPGGAGGPRLGPAHRGSLLAGARPVPPV